MQFFRKGGVGGALFRHRTGEEIEIILRTRSPTHSKWLLVRPPDRVCSGCCGGAAGLRGGQLHLPRGGAPPARRPRKASVVTLTARSRVTCGCFVFIKLRRCGGLRYWHVCYTCLARQQENLQYQEGEHSEYPEYQDDYYYYEDYYGDQAMETQVTWTRILHSTVNLGSDDEPAGPAWLPGPVLCGGGPGRGRPGRPVRLHGDARVGEYLCLRLHSRGEQLVVTDDD